MDGGAGVGVGGVVVAAVVEAGALKSEAGVAVGAVGEEARAGGARFAEEGEKGVPAAALRVAGGEEEEEDEEEDRLAGVVEAGVALARGGVVGVVGLGSKDDSIPDLIR